MNIVIVLMVIILMSCTIWLVYKGAAAASDPDNTTFGDLEFVVSSMVLLCFSILISYFPIVYVVMAPEPAVTQSSHHKVYTSKKS